MSDSENYQVVEGQVRNIGSQPLRSIQVVATWFTDDGTFISSDSAMIDFNPLMPGQTSPYKTMTTRNPLMKRYSVDFKPIFGTPLATKDSRKK